MKSISARILHETIQNQQEEIQLIDVREKYELEICNLANSVHIPLNDIPDRIEKINKSADKVVIYCRSGVRSANAINWLEENYPMDNLYNLEGGILAWANEIDTSLEQY